MSIENEAILSSQRKIKAKFELFESAQDQEILNASSSYEMLSRKERKNIQANIIRAKLFLYKEDFWHFNGFN